MIAPTMMTSNKVPAATTKEVVMEEEETEVFEMVEEVIEEEHDGNNVAEPKSETEHKHVQHDDQEMDEDNDLLEFEKTLGRKKKKKKAVVHGAAVSADATTDCGDITTIGTRDYTYLELLQRVTGLLKANNPSLSGAKVKKILPPPIMIRIGSRRVGWANYGITCQILRRSPEHLKSFILAETGSDGSIDGSQRLIVKGRFGSKEMEALLKKYIFEYVTCHMCRRIETSLSRDGVTRLHFLACDTCGSRRAVAPITFFHATNRADRRAAAAAAT